MTEEDKRSIAKYMNLHTYPKFDWNEEASRFAEGITGNVKWDMNFAALCVKEMQKRGDWSYFYDDLLDTYNGLCEDCKEPCGADNFTAWLFNADNFFTAMAAWIKEEEK